jgi:predicted nucleotidyltransferase
MASPPSNSNTVAEIRARKLQRRLANLRNSAERLVVCCPGSSLWLFGSLARGDWDAYSDVDMLAIAATSEDAETLADAVFSHQVADDVLALSTTEWERLRCSQDPYWQAIGRDALCLAKG